MYLKHTHTLALFYMVEFHYEFCNKLFFWTLLTVLFVIFISKKELTVTTELLQHYIMREK